MYASEKTRYKLAEAMKRLMESQPLEKITVTQITELCDTTRPTFYRYFKDKYDLINWYFDKLVLTCFEQIGVSHTVEESLTQKLRFIREEKAFFMGAFRSDDHNSLKEHDFELILRFYEELISKRSAKAISEEIQFLLEMYCQGSVYMTVKWILGGMKEAPEDMARKLVEAMPPKLEKVFAESGLL